MRGSIYRMGLFKTATLTKIQPNFGRSDLYRSHPKLSRLLLLGLGFTGISKEKNT